MAAVEAYRQKRSAYHDVNTPFSYFLLLRLKCLKISFLNFLLKREIRKLKEEKNTSILFVTHDIEEAVYLGDRVVVMAANPGVIKDIINIDIEGRKDRTNTEFLSYKNKIYDYFFEDRNKNAVEYNI